MEAAREGGLPFAFRKISKNRWIRGFGTNDLCKTAIFQVIKVYFWGGMAERAELANGQLIMDN